MGQQVLLKDENGTVAAAGKITSSDYVDVYSSDGYEFANCLFHVLVPDVPQRSFYTVQVANRAGPTYSYNDLQSSGWTIKMDIGSGSP